MNERDTVSVSVQHRFSASAERVYDAWLDPEKASKFLFATAQGHTVRCEIDARIGGGFTIVDRRDGEDVAHTGTYLELDRPRRIVFSLSVEKYSKDSSRVTIDIAPLAQGCEVTLTHQFPAQHADMRKRTSEGWEKILELASLVVVAGPETCGQGLAQHATLPAKIAPVFAALAETLELHRSMIVKGGAPAKTEDEAYQSLAETYRALAEQVERAASRMAACRDLPMAPHDEHAFGKPQFEAFERLVNAQNALLAVLKIAAERDEDMLKGMRGDE
ncbi:MAG TPA: SRPBCC family protein [Polyangiaceae bacterium]|nr:SRPBCC family protein [Polyangiaceae bacterium]